jgi:hypothetical protein
MWQAIVERTHRASILTASVPSRLVTGNLLGTAAGTARRLADVVHSGRNDIDGFDGLVTALSRLARSEDSAHSAVSRLRLAPPGLRPNAST